MARSRHGDLAGVAGGGKYPPEYVAWKNMRRRCTDPKTSNYHHYGGRGITVCDRWLRSYSAFLADMGRRPVLKGKKGRSLYTLERLDNEKGYTPDNCVWATQQAQMANKRRLKKHEQAPYWMRHTWGSRHADSADEYILVIPKNLPSDWRV